MKITVDTDTDSQEDIKKIIALLQEKISSSSGALNIFGDDTPSASSQTFNIFEQSSPTSTPSEPAPESAMGNTMFNIFEQPVEKVESPSETVDSSSETPTGFFESMGLPDAQSNETTDAPAWPAVKEEEESDSEEPMIDIFDLEEY